MQFYHKCPRINLTDGQLFFSFLPEIQIHLVPAINRSRVRFIKRIGRARNIHRCDNISEATLSRTPRVPEFSYSRVRCFHNLFFPSSSSSSLSPPLLTLKWASGGALDLGDDCLLLPCQFAASSRHPFKFKRPYFIAETTSSDFTFFPEIIIFLTLDAAVSAHFHKHKSRLFSSALPSLFHFLFPVIFPTELPLLEA